MFTPRVRSVNFCTLEKRSSPYSRRRDTRHGIWHNSRIIVATILWSPIERYFLRNNPKYPNESTPRRYHRIVRKITSARTIVPVTIAPPRLSEIAFNFPLKTASTRLLVRIEVYLPVSSERFSFNFVFRDTRRRNFSPWTVNAPGTNERSMKT